MSQTTTPTPMVNSGAFENPADHREWCCADECKVNEEFAHHESVTSSIVATNDGQKQYDVCTTVLYNARLTGAAAVDGPLVRFSHDRMEGYHFTAAEARQLAQALLNHADLADGTFIPSPADRAATLVASLLAHTGHDPNRLHDTLVQWIDVMVDAMAAAR